LPPRLARMVISAAELGHAEEAAEIAAVFAERGLGGNDADLAHRLEGFRRDRSRRASDLRKLAAGWARMASAGRAAQEPHGDMSLARLLALAFPERIGKARGAPGQVLLANGRGANLDATHPLARSPSWSLRSCRERRRRRASCSRPQPMKRAFLLLRASGSARRTRLNSIRAPLR
jgi:ATP-dependent helicase HrpB